jgi:hypothetical protein
MLIPSAQKDAVGTQAHKHESRVLDKDAVKSDDFLERERVLSRLLDSATPSLEAVARRTLALDLETRDPDDPVPLYDVEEIRIAWIAYKAECRGV